MYRVDWIKKQNIISLVLGVGMFLLGILNNSLAISFKDSVQYYWSSEVRQGVSAFLGIAVFLAMLVFLVGCSIFVFYLNINDKVCSECKLVYPKFTITCFKCKNNIAYAKSILKYRAELADVGMPTMNAGISYSSVQNNVNVSREEFCPSCDQKMKGADHFCPRGGKKN